MAGITTGHADEHLSGFSMPTLLELIIRQTESAKSKLAKIRSGSESSISIADMFEMQMLMNKLAQFSEMGANVINAAHTATMTMARKISG